MPYPPKQVEIERGILETLLELGARRIVMTQGSPE